MFKSLGNLLLNLHVGLLFIDFEQSDRMRINGIATIHAEEDPLLAEYPGAQLIIRVQAERIFPNCPRSIHNRNPTSSTIEPDLSIISILASAAHPTADADTIY